MASMHCHPRKSTSIENPNHFWHLGSRIQMGDVWGQKHRFNVTWYDVNRPPLWKIKKCKSSKCESKSKQLRKKPKRQSLDVGGKNIRRALPLVGVRKEEVP